ncbi:MAG: hypothetical protein K0R14_203 [Burkholderiales bacterium]|nr:hypothetical protein [Burkholderiales bacterium]
MNRLAFWAIFIIPVFWGIGFPLTHNAVATFNPGLFAFYRQVVATICLLPIALWSFKEINKRIIIGGLLLGLFNTLSILSQSYALSIINSAMTAFFITLNIIFVPFLVLIFRAGKFKTIDITIVSLGIISILVTFNGNLNSFSRGDLFGLFAAFTIAMNITMVQIMTKHQSMNRLLLSFFSVMFGMLFLSYYPIIYTSYGLFKSSSVWAAIIYQGAISTALAVVLQMLFQKKVGPTRTGVILNLDLVFASLFGLVNGELLTLSQILGGIIAIFASFFQDIWQVFKSKCLQMPVSKK